jgi:hypothetical protein
MQRRNFFSLVLFGVTGRLVAAERKPVVRSYRIYLPNHVLEFSLPEEIARDLREGRVPEYFDPTEPKAFERGFRPLLSTLYDFNGAFWVGAKGSFKFYIFIQQRAPEFEGDISTIDGLEKYIEWWIPKVRNPAFCTFGRSVLNGNQALSRRFDNSQEIISVPLDKDMFIEFGLTLMYWARGSKGWVKKAHAMSDEIRASIVLKPRQRSS